VVEQLPYIVAGILVLLLFWLLAKIIRSIFWATTTRAKLDNRLRILFSRLIGIFILILGIFTAFTVIVPSFRFGDLIAGLGFTSFIVGFATKDILNNLLSGVLILWKQPFHIGDYIFVKDKQGKVEYIGVRATTLRMDDGEQILMPNGDMYSNALVIRGAGAERRMKLNISIGYEADIKHAKSNILSVLENLDGVIDEPKSNVYVTDLASEGVKLSIYFWINTDTHKAIDVVDTVATAIKESLSRADIELYPPGSVIVQNADAGASANYSNGKDDL
jgi:small-conductance mechanosensitive channel